MSAEPERIRLAQAIGLGVLHGPAELLPISSSGHVTLVPWLLSWEYAELDDELRKAFEVVLHAGTAAALLITLRDEVLEAVGDLTPRRVHLVALSFLPPAVAGYVFERPIERRLGTPGTVAVALVAGAAAMAAADRTPQRRRHDDTRWLDALCLGLAQASALIPGVSRNGATLAAARLRGFRREDSNRLSRHAALPIIAGATLLKTHRLWRRRLPAGTLVPFAAGALAAFFSTLGSTWLISQVERDRSLLPYALYRAAMAGIVLQRLRRRSGPAR